MPRRNGECHRTWLARIADIIRRRPDLEGSDLTSAYLAESVRWSA